MFDATTNEHSSQLKQVVIRERVKIKILTLHRALPRYINAGELLSTRLIHRAGFQKIMQLHRIFKNTFVHNLLTLCT